MSYRYPLGLFEATGIEIEYMIVDGTTLAVAPVADRLIEAQSGCIESEIELGDLAWSNELALHVIELKTNGPSPSLANLASRFQSQVEHANRLLEGMGARLLPTGMHPWMDPHEEFRIWPHQQGQVYATFHRIFDCRGHGWANLQSTHLNLPFADDDEFGRLHAAIRLLLPLLPALAASSPLRDGAPTGFLDARLEAYRSNSRRIASVAGCVIPEPVFTRREYEACLLGRIYEDLRPHDPEGILLHEWVNARGCIARFDRGAIEIRILDVQECPAADVAIAAATIAVVRALVEDRWISQAEQRRWETSRLAAIFQDVIRLADGAVIHDRDYLRALGHPGRGPTSARELWNHLVEATLEPSADQEEWRPHLERILEQGCLGGRILGVLDGDTRPERVREVYAELGRCLATGRGLAAAP